MRRPTALFALAAIAALAAAAPADAFLLELLAAKFGGGSSSSAGAAAPAPAPVAAAAAEPVAAVIATKPAPRPMMMAKPAAKPAAVAAVAAAKPAPAVAAAAVAAKPAPAVAAAAAAATPAATAAAAAAAPSSCPPAGFDSAANLDLSRYIEKRWYTYAQRPVSYQPVESLFCVSALYTPIDEAKGPAGGVNVRNYSNRGGVNGASMGTSGAGGPSAPSRIGGPPAGAEPFSMIALPHPLGGANSTNPDTAASKLIVGPKPFLQGAPLPVLARVLGANYRVVAFDDEDYEWAIVISGTPDVDTGKGCTVSGDGGFWLFSRTPEPSDETRAAVEAAAEELGLDVSGLTPVPQAGCKYEGA
jgi:lipocalin